MISNSGLNSRRPRYISVVQLSDKYTENNKIQHNNLYMFSLYIDCSNIFNNNAIVFIINYLSHTLKIIYNSSCFSIYCVMDSFTCCRTVIHLYGKIIIELIIKHFPPNKYTKLYWKIYFYPKFWESWLKGINYLNNKLVQQYWVNNTILSQNHYFM